MFCWICYYSLSTYFFNINVRNISKCVDQFKTLENNLRTFFNNLNSCFEFQIIKEKSSSIKGKEICVFSCQMYCSSYCVNKFYVWFIIYVFSCVLKLHCRDLWHICTLKLKWVLQSTQKHLWMKNLFINMYFFQNLYKWWIYVTCLHFQKKHYIFTQKNIWMYNLFINI